MTASTSLGETPIRPLFFQYYVPALISIASTTLHQLINGIILGQQVGKEGLGAVGLYGPVVIVFVSLTLPIMIGGGILIGKRIGAGDYDKVQQVFRFATTLVLLTGGVVALMAPLLARPLAQFLAGAQNAALADKVADYAFWQLISLPVFFLGMIWGNFVRTDNAPRVSRNASLTAVAINLVLDLLLIVGLRMGVEGASIATAVAFASGALYLLVYIWKGKSHFSVRPFQFTLRLAEWKELLTLGIPSFASELAFSAGLLFISRSLTTYGPGAVAAFGLVNYVSFIFIRPLTAAMIASLPIMSFNIGAGRPDRVLATFRFAFGFTFGLGVLVTAIGLFIPQLLITLFAGDETGEFRQTASEAIRLYFLLFLAAGPNYVVGAYLQSIGRANLSSLISVLKGAGLVTLFLYVLPGYFGLGLSGIWLSRSLAELSALLLVGLYMLYRQSEFFSEQVIRRS
ncbi:Multidrug export protein mepA [Fibrisoma limi BUZ 3]|uniref:Multidrug export protein mepA n=1 Tax=Fibrisoma limi BUZ 3 TaxID=1185876 RepID=I2GEW5_9BACT|nr:MATE family efflux transporter [Fibrisoma limi]CCH52440.1 Multidrug export protein mepA [Fibrisoma limi BUZ 3]